MTDSQTAEATPAKKKTPPKAPVGPAYSTRTLRAKHRKTLKARLATDKEFAKAYFDGRSKRSAARKLAFRKRHSKGAAK